MTLGVLPRSRYESDTLSVIAVVAPYITHLILMSLEYEVSDLLIIIGRVHAPRS